MGAFIQQILNLPINPPGNLVYHMILTFSVAGALQASLAHWQRSGLPHSRRMATGLSLLLAIRLALFLGAGAAMVDLLPSAYLPPVDRGITLLSLILILWLWAFPEPLRLADAATVLLSLLTLTLLALVLLSSTVQGQSLSYNGSLFDISGEGVTLAILLGGLLALLLRRPNGWGYGLGMLLVLAAGHIAHLLFPQPGDYSGAARLAQMAAYPMLLILPQRFPLQAARAQPLPLPKTQARRRFGAEPKLIQAFLSLATEADPTGRCQAITRAVAHTMLAELCLLVSPSDRGGKVILSCGYDLIREINLGSASLPEKSIPVIESVLRNGRPVRLPASSTSPDLISLAETLKLDRVGNFLAMPILTASGAALAEIILLSPYSNRAWDAEDQTLLADLAAPLAQLLHPQPQDAVEAAPPPVDQAEIEPIKREREALQAQLERLQGQLNKEHLQLQSLTAVVSVQEEARQNAERNAQEAIRTVNSLKAENERIKQTAQAPGGAFLTIPKALEPAEIEFLEGEYHLALEEIARLKTALAEADGTTLPVGSGLGEHPTQVEHARAAASIAHDLRQPLISVKNTADFLLAESVGPLGELQRKFLERIKASTERLSRLVDDLVQVTSQESGSVGRAPLTTGIDGVLQSAVTQTESQRSEKGIKLTLDLPGTALAVQAESQILQQIITKLLQNAGSVTPTGGQVSLRTQVQHGEDKHEYLLVQVSDQGGGISAEDLPRVFSGLHPIGATILPGTGKPCAELGMIRSLVESLEGRIWVDSQPGGSVFSVLLPTPAKPGEGGPTA